MPSTLGVILEENIHPFMEHKQEVFFILVLFPEIEIIIKLINNFNIIVNVLYLLLAFWTLKSEFCQIFQKATDLHNL